MARRVDDDLRTEEPSPVSAREQASGTACRLGNCAPRRLADPGSVHLDRSLVLEKSHRGHSVAIMALKIELVTPGPDFSISADGKMPVVTLRLTGPELPAAAPDAGAAPVAITCDWVVKLTFNCADAPHGPSRVVAHPDIAVRTTKPELTIPFSKIRGGNLSIAVVARIGTQTLQAELTESGGKPLRVAGTNPSKSQLHLAIPSRALRLIVQNESSCRQFDSGLPLFSRDNLGGVGLLQITSPPPSDDEIWDWQANVRAAITLFAGKLAAARGFPRQVRTNARFVSLARSYNADREKAGKRALDIRLPDFTEEQVELDAIRGYNGYAGTDFFLGPRHLHEFRVVVRDATGAAPSLVVTEDRGQAFGTAQWERVPPGVRPRPFDGYVDNVTSKGDF